MNATYVLVVILTYVLVVILSLGLLIRKMTRGPTVETHPVGTTPRPPGANRLEQTVRFCPPCERFARIKAAYDRGEIDEARALYLLECD